jgi:antitoxin component YwqK of YwqJK toxin-antitoxin module
MESGVLVSQGFKSGDKFDGWFITHYLGSINTIKFYEDGIATKGFGSFQENSNLKYKVNYKNKTSSPSLIIVKFLFETLPKLNKPGNLVEFLSNPDNITLLDELSFPYDSKTGEGDLKADYKIFSSTGLEQICKHLEYSDNKVCINYVGSYAYIGLIESSNPSKLLNGKLYLLVQPELKHSIRINETNISLNYELIGDDITLKEEGEFIIRNNHYLLEGTGEKIDGTNKYVGTFENGEIKQGILYKSNIKIYEGSFTSNKFNGFGTEWSSNGHMRYQGEYKNGKFHGNGTSYYPNAETESVEYVGNWSNDQKHGQGTLFSVSGDEIFTGEFYRDQIA